LNITDGNEEKNPWTGAQLLRTLGHHQEIEHKNSWRRGAEIQTKDIENPFEESMAEKFPNLGKDMDIQI
jgi:hypothetical protein